MVKALSRHTETRERCKEYERGPCPPADLIIPVCYDDAVLALSYTTANAQPKGTPVLRPRYQLIALDLDGTLLNEHSQVSPRTREALVRAHEAGVAIVVATGRSYELARHFCGDLPLSGPQITFNGAIIVDPITHQPIFLQAVPSDTIAPVLRFLEREDVFACYYTGDTIYVLEHSPLEVALTPPGMPQPIEVPDFAVLAHLPCIKIVAVAAPERISSLRPLAESDFGADLYVTRTSPVLLEFLHPSVSKGTALRRVMEALDLEPAEVIAFGDSHNDISMLEAAGTGVAMANADAEVREAASLVAPSNREDGVAAILDRMLWQPV